MENKFKLDVAKSVKKGGKTIKEKVGQVEVPYPTLPELGIDATIKEVNEDGIAQYATDLENFLQGAVVERVKGMARNRLQSGSTEYKDPARPFPATLEELTKPAVMGGNAEAMKAIAELKRQFKTYIAEAGVSEKGQTFLAQLFEKPSAITTQPQPMKDKVASRVEGFAAWLEDQDDYEVSATEEGYLGRVLDACSESEELELDDF